MTSTGPRVADLTATHVTALAREAVHGNARFRTETTAPGVFRVRPADAHDPATTTRLLIEVRDHLTRFGYEAVVGRARPPRGEALGAQVLTVTDTPRRQREMAEQTERRHAVLARELGYASVEDYLAAPGRAAWIADPELSGYPAAEESPAECPTCTATAPGEACFGCGAVTETTVEQWGPDAVAVTREYDTTPAYPPHTTAEAEELAEVGLYLVADRGAYAQRVEETRTHRRLGTVRCVTEELGRGFYVRFAAYRPDGSRVGYAPTRPEAARLLLPLSEQTQETLARR